MAGHPVGARVLSVATPREAHVGRAASPNGPPNPVAVTLDETGVATLAPMGPLGPLPHPRTPTLLVRAVDAMMKGMATVRARRLAAPGVRAPPRLAALLRLRPPPAHGMATSLPGAPRSALRPPEPISLPRWSRTRDLPAAAVFASGLSAMAPARIETIFAMIALPFKAPGAATAPSAMLFIDLLLAIGCLERPRIIRSGRPRPAPACTAPPRRRQFGGGMRLGRASPIRQTLPLTPVPAPFCFIVQRRQGLHRGSALLYQRMGPLIVLLRACRRVDGCGGSSRHLAGPPRAPSQT